MEVGEKVAEKLFSLDPNPTVPLVILSNMYAVLGRWGQKSILRKRLQSVKLRKDPGCSWIELNNIHLFSVEDKTHPYSDLPLILAYPSIISIAAMANIMDNVKLQTANPITGILGVMMLDGGFYRLPSDIPKPFWRYPLHYISFHKYAYQGLFKNEFQDLTFTDNNQDGGAMINISGEEILRNLWQVEIGYSKWNDVAILIGMAVTYRILFLVIIKSFEKVKPIVVTAMNNCPQAKFRFTKILSNSGYDYRMDYKIALPMDE
ncbi:hypothetical protein Ahy_B08g092635 isoform B [Arachis hypogaea]|uniref:Uncharacterized protein n=1 Tax=Arachis hypogaea TaxID=3818 RepID=A0A444Y4C1_ARAHY|nr:hypothetical protein Ahy_B08g092635 isoform B [Arachis hypogaea]